jgi:hypothetical protein
MCGKTKECLLPNQINGQKLFQIQLRRYELSRYLYVYLSVYKSSPTTRHGGAGGRGGIAPTHSRLQHYMGVRGQRHAPAALFPKERTPGTHCTGGWVVPRARLHTEARGKILSPLPGIEPRSPGRPVRSQTLY